MMISSGCLTDFEILKHIRLLGHSRFSCSTRPGFARAPLNPGSAPAFASSRWIPAISLQFRTRPAAEPMPCRSLVPMRTASMP